MARLTDLPILNRADLDGTEALPVVKDDVTYQAALEDLNAAAAERAEIAALAAAAIANMQDSQADGEAATIAGDVFSFPDGAGNVFLARRELAGSTPFAQLATKALVDAAVAAAGLKRDEAAAAAGAAATDRLYAAAERAAAEAARADAIQASLGAGFVPGARGHVPKGLTLTAITAPGAGGANGVYLLTTTGGNFAVRPQVTVTVEAGALASIEIAGPGHYIGAAPDAGALDLSPIAGLAGAAIALTAGTKVGAGDYWLTDHATDPNQAALFQNQAGAAVEVDASVDWLNVSATLAAANALTAINTERQWMLSVDGRVLWDETARTLSFPRIYLRNRANSSTKTFTPAATFNTAPFAASVAQYLYLDTGAAANANPLVIGTGALAVDGAKLPLAMFWLGQLTWFVQLPVVTIKHPTQNLQHIGSNLPIVFFRTAGFGVPAMTWMVPRTLRARKNGTTGAWTNLNTIANAASAYVDPTGTYNWSLYAAVPATFATGENSLYLDPGDDTVKSADRATELKGTNAGFAPLAMYHASGQLQALNGVRVVYGFRDPETLFARSPLLAQGKMRALAPIRAKLRAIAAGAVNTRCKILLLGDSWIYRPDFANFLRDTLQAEGFAILATGWMGVQDAEWTKANWTTVDAAPAGETQAVGSELNSLDGLGLRSTAANSTAARNFTGDTLTIYYQKLSGAFRYRLDGGGWTVVAGDSSDTLGKVTIPGLAAGVHALEIDTTGNAGTVLIHGAYATATTGSGVEIIKAGNGSSEGRDWDTFEQYVGSYIADIQPDALIVLLATNDQNQSNLPAELGGPSTPESYIAGVKNLVAAVRAAKADVRTLSLTPPANGSSGTTPMTAFADHNAAWSQLATDVDYINFAYLWDSYAAEQARGMWDVVAGGAPDPMHLSALGMREMVDAMWRAAFAIPGGY